MPSLKDIRRRIGSVKNTQKITRAMKLVAAAKFARANAAVVAARPYGAAFQAMVERLVAAAGGSVPSPLLNEREEHKILLVLLSTDRGFCGGLNSNLFKQAVQFINAKRRDGVQVDLMPWGRRARQFSAKLSYEVQDPREKVLDKPSYGLAKELAADLVHRFEHEGYDRVYLGFVEFKSAMSQVPKFAQVLPVGKSHSGRSHKEPEIAFGPGILVEPSIQEVLEQVLKREVAGLIFRAMLEGAASEHGARMTAMDSATNNANEVLRRMKIQYNRARQAAITKELIEITSGAQAL
jgi:F-type H+-transporting ATPase subunit gamma